MWACISIGLLYMCDVRLVFLMKTIIQNRPTDAFVWNILVAYDENRDNLNLNTMCIGCNNSRGYMKPFIRGWLNKTTSYNLSKSQKKCLRTFYLHASKIIKNMKFPKHEELSPQIAIRFCIGSCSTQWKRLSGCKNTASYLNIRYTTPPSSGYSCLSYTVGK